METLKYCSPGVFRYTTFFYSVPLLGKAVFTSTSPLLGKAAFLMMGESIELKTVKNCSISLDKALKSPENKIVFFLNINGFITDKVCASVLNPNSSLTADNKTYQLIEGIKNRIDQDKDSYQVLIDGFTQGGIKYTPIVRKLEEEYAKQTNPNMQSCKCAYMCAR